MENTASFKVYDASAGSGKTFTLVKNYIAQLFLSQNKTAYKNVLAITFTNKAVTEMKSRVIDSLRAFSEETIPPNYSDLFNEVKKETGLETEEVQKKAREILKSILHNYAAFEISTIDRFTHRVLRTFAKDLNIPVNFEVELETDEILQEAVDRVIAKSGTDKALTKTLVDFALTKADDDRSWDIAYDLNKIAKLLVNEDNFMPLAKLRGKTVRDFADFAKDLRKEIKILKSRCVEKAEAFFDLLQQNGLENGDFTRKYIPNHFEKLLKGNLPYPSGAKWQQNIETGTLYNKGLNEGKKATIDALQPEIASLYRSTETALFKIEFYKRLLKKNTALSLLTTIEKEVAEIKDERGLLLISEFNKKISESIKDQPAPFIYERLGERYHTYFIDEFQDTSILQWENLKPLIANSLASSTGKLSLVGDAKQSIYRWRGGKAEQFMALCAKDGKNPFHIEKEREDLPNNYRSLPEVVNFNNAFFGHAAQFMQHDAYRELFENAKQTPVKTKGGYVNISFIEADNVAEEEEIYPQKVLEIINTLEEKGHNYSDVCILVRRKTQGIAVADYLSENEVPIISSETLLLEKSPKVNFITAVLGFSLNRTDKNLKFELLNFLYERLDLTKSAFAFMHSRLEFDGDNFFSSLEEHGLSFDLKKLHRLPLYDAVEYSLRAFNLLETQDAYVQFFLDFVYEYTQRNTGGIAGFLDLWELKRDKLSIAAPEGENAVQIMTIHKAKGLEFPVVIYPFANEKIDDTTRDEVWVELEEEPNDIPVAYPNASKKLLDFGESPATAYNELLIHKELDAMNIFYVTMTRAKEQLYILSKLDLKKGEEKTNTFSGLLINFLKAQNDWKDDKLSYDFGEMTENSSVVAKVSETEQKRISSSAPEAHAVNIVTKSGLLWGTPQEKAIEEGNLIHDLLKTIYVEDDIAETVEEAALNGTILESETKNYTQKLKTLVGHPELKLYFSGTYDVFTEKEIITENTFKRLDRLCLNGEKAVIIDYKTGGFQKKHKTQINGYAKAIEAMGFAVEEKLLVYLDKEALRIETIA